MSGAHALIMATSASSAAHPCTPARSEPRELPDGDEVAGFSREDIIEVGIGSVEAPLSIGVL
jgi:hypothetical protein